VWPDRDNVTPSLSDSDRATDSGRGKRNAPRDGAGHTPLWGALQGTRKVETSGSGSEMEDKTGSITPDPVG